MNGSQSPAPVLSAFDLSVAADLDDAFIALHEALPVARWQVKQLASTISVEQRYTEARGDDCFYADLTAEQALAATELVDDGGWRHIDAHVIACLVLAQVEVG